MTPLISCIYCNEDATSKGMCRKHYNQWYWENNKSKILSKRLNIEVPIETLNQCEICGNKESILGKNKKIRSLSLDHDHITGKFRGFLCFRCNLVLGHINDNIELLKKMVNYLDSANLMYSNQL